MHCAPRLHLIEPLECLRAFKRLSNCDVCCDPDSAPQKHPPLALADRVVSSYGVVRVSPNLSYVISSAEGLLDSNGGVDRQYYAFRDNLLSSPVENCAVTSATMRTNERHHPVSDVCKNRCFPCWLPFALHQISPPVPPITHRLQ